MHFLRIRKSSTTALNVQDDSSVDVFNVDTTNKTVTSYNQKIASLAGTGNRMVTADASGNLSAPLNRFVTTYYEGTLDNVPNNSWTFLMECPTGKTTIAISTQESFYSTTIYYSQAEFARALSGSPVTIYAVDGGIAYLTKIRINGNNIEVVQTSGAASMIRYRYKVENSRV